MWGQRARVTAILVSLRLLSEVSVVKQRERGRRAGLRCNCAAPQTHTEGTGIKGIEDYLRMQPVSPVDRANLAISPLFVGYQDR